MPPDYQDLNRYVAFMGVETKRGCPNNCSYCLYPVLQGRRMRLRSPERVADELETSQCDPGIEAYTLPMLWLISRRTTSGQYAGKF